jgi:phosphoribosylamine---glycine ligase
MRFLVVGRGGREHALAIRLAEDVDAADVLLAPGNEGASRSFRCLAIAEHETEALAEACRSERIDLVVIGPEGPLAAGIVEALGERRVLAFGPGREAARLESSKWFAKQIMFEAGVPTARGERHERVPEAVAALARFAPPWVIKLDGLASGKGVCVTAERERAEEFIAAGFTRGHAGGAQAAVVIEEFLEGLEASVMAVCDGRRHVLLTPARDYKRALAGDRGANTGGMGAFAPVAAGETFEREVSERIVTPVLREMERRGTPFRGVLYVGLMIGPRGLSVVEFNVRFGDPETQVILPLTGGSLARLLMSAARGELDAAALSRRGGAAVAVALVDTDYPNAARGGGRIEGLERVLPADAHVVYAAVTWEDAAWTVRGGRGAYVVAKGANRAAARTSVYAAIAKLGGTGWRCREDIGAGDERAAAQALGPPASRGRED